MLAALAGTNQLGGLEAVHLRHLDVQQDSSEIILQQVAQSLGSRACGDQVLIQRFQCRLKGNQVVRIIIDKKDFYLLARQRFFPFRVRTCHLTANSTGSLSRRRAHTAAPDETRLGTSSARREIQTRMTAKSCSRSTGFVT